MTAALILASGSAVRRDMLLQASVPHRVDVSSVDEGAIKAQARSEGLSPADCAETLAVLKAQRVSQRHPGALVIGADQILTCGADWFDKPDSVDSARTQLQTLRGKTHQLTSAAAIVHDGQAIWRAVDEANLTMRNFSDDWLEDYLSQSGTDILQSVGCYRVEAMGVQLFSKIEGSHFTILGLPLLPLLAFLREHGSIAS